MATRPRIKRLHDLLDQIAMLPVSPERDRLLTEIRSRAVDVDTGVKPRAMLAMQEPSPAPVVRTPPQRERVRAPRRWSPPPAAPAVELPRPSPLPAGRSAARSRSGWMDGCRWRIRCCPRRCLVFERGAPSGPSVDARPARVAVRPRGRYRGLVLRRRELPVDQLDAVAVGIGHEADPVLVRPPG